MEWCRSRSWADIDDKKEIIKIPNGKK